MRILSLLPSLTEIICALGLERHLVGRSHECDFPESVRDLPVCTEPKFPTDGTSYGIDQRVRAIVQEGVSVYRVDADLVAKLQPDLILTQDHCEVCALSLDEVTRVARSYLGPDTRILSLSPANLDEVFLSIQEVAEAAGDTGAGERLIRRMIDRFNGIRSKTELLPSPRIACLEWLAPPMAAGNWFPELATIAGGRSVLGRAGEHSPWIEWEQLSEADPDILLVSPCGYDLDKTAGEMEQLTEWAKWDTLQAVADGRIFLLEGNHYFHRPGPRLAESAEILAEIFHPGLFEPSHRGSGWKPYQT